MTRKEGGKGGFRGPARGDGFSDALVVGFMTLTRPEFPWKKGDVGNMERGSRLSAMLCSFKDVDGITTYQAKEKIKQEDRQKKKN